MGINIFIEMFFSLKKDSRTRGHEAKLVKNQCRLDIRKHSFSQRKINEINKLSTDCITASRFNKIAIPNNKFQMASGQGSHWLIESPTIFSSMCSPPLSNICQFYCEYV